MTEKEYWFWLSNIEGIGERSVDKLLRLFGSPEEIYQLKSSIMENCTVLSKVQQQSLLLSRQNPEKTRQRYHSMIQKGIKFITTADEEYPRRLRPFTDKPPVLYVKGRLPADGRPSAAVIGARKASRYGIDAARYFGSELAAAGIQVVSGMALGIDGAAQEGALLAGGDTYGVLGSGVDICYPKAHWNLYHDIQGSGGIISEFAPGSRPDPWNFPMRNRIISGLADCIIVIEAKKESGSLITVEQALDQGKEVFALPGRYSEPLSGGCHDLIRQGAVLLTGVEDIYDFFHINRVNITENSEKNVLVLASKEKVLYSCLNLEPKHIEVIAREAGMDLQGAAAILMELEYRRIVKQTGGNYYSI